MSESTGYKIYNNLKKLIVPHLARGEVTALLKHGCVGPMLIGLGWRINWYNITMFDIVTGKSASYSIGKLTDYYLCVMLYL